MTTEEFGRRLRKLRESKMLTRRELSVKSNVPQATIANYEQDIAQPFLNNAVKLADGLGVTLGQLAGLPGDGERFKAETFNERLWLARKRRDVRVGELAALVGASWSTIVNYTSNRICDRNFFTLIKLAEALNVDLDWLCGRG